VDGYNTDVLGCVVERASGTPLDEFVRTRITEPLGMKDTRFFLRPEDRSRLAAVYASGPDGKAVRAPDGPKGQGTTSTASSALRRRCRPVSTARDYGRFPR
jgi:CubicO group peptidase (beta-lactamase class C family)